MCSKYSRSKDWDHMIKRITTIITKIKHLTIVFDGGSTEEKQVTHIKRLESKRQSIQDLQYFVDSLCKDNGDQEGAEDKVSLKRAVFYPLLCSKYSRLKDWDHMVKRITTIIPKSKHLTIVFDGGSTEEKQVTHIKRLESKRQSVQALQYFVDSLCKDNGDQEGAEDKVSLKRVSKSKKILMKKLIMKAFVLTKQDKEEIMALLKRLGYQIEQAAEEKQVTHIKRLESKRQSIQDLQYFVDSLCKDNGDQEGAEDKVSLKRVSKAKKILMKKLIKKAFVLTKQDKEEIMALLKRLGYKIEQAAGEADVFIGTRKGRVNVISTDSDMVFHLNDGIWAVPSLQGNNLMIRYIDVAEARNKLKLNLASLRALAVLSGNDYCSNVRGWAIASVYKWIRQYRKADLESCNKIVQSFLETVGSDSNFDKAIMIFECKEEHVLHHDARTEKLLQLSLLIRRKITVCVSEVPPLPLKKRPKQPEEILESQIEALQENLDGSESNEDSGFTASTTVHNSSKKRKKKSAKHQPSSRNFRNKPDAAEAEEHVLHHDARTEKLLQLSLFNKESIKKWDNYNIAWKDKQENYIGNSDNLDLKRWTHKNPFRVLGEKFNDDNESLTRYKYKTVDRKSLCVSEVPPLPLKKRPKQPEEILESQIEALQENLDGSKSNEESGSSASTTVHNSSKKRKKTSAKHQPSSRNFRNKPDAAEAGATGSRNVTDESREMSSLKAKFVTKTWSIGALSTRNRQRQYAQYEKEIIHCFKSIIKLNENTLKLDDMILGDTKGQGGRKFWQPCMSFLNGTGRDETESVGLNLFKNDMILGDTKGQGGRKFWQPCMSFLNGTGRDETESVGLNLFKSCINKKLFSGREVKSLKLYTLSKFSMCQATDFIAKQLDTEFAGQVVGRVKLLEEVVFEYDSNLKDDINKLQKLCKSKVEYFYKLNQLLPSNKRWSMFSLSRVPDLAITVNESGLLDVLKQVVPVFKRISNDFVIQNKGWFFMELFGKNFGDNRNRHLRLQNDTSNKRYILQNTLQTDGVELRVHVLDTAEKKKRNVLQPTQEIDFDEGLFDNAGVKPSDVVYDKVPKMTEDEAKDCYFVGVDLGYKYSAGVCAVQESSNTIRNLAIRKNALRGPLKKYNRWFYKQKYENEWVYETERLMERTESETASNFATRWFNCYSKLYAFYNSLSMKKNRWDIKKALRGEFDRAVHAILRMVEMKINYNLKREAFKNKRIVIGIGASKFEMGDNTHTLFEKHLVMKLRSLGYTVVCVEEYLTSQMCPRCFNRTEQLKMRVKYCRHCHVFYHRDVMAGENMARVLRDEVTGKGRPEHLRYKPPDKPSPDYSASISDEIGDKTLDDSAEDNVSVSLVKKGKRRLDMSH
ncbi:hypothetical protein MP638_002209 [Amoeboaphelidium occidentale]|nr:hypothetical protein MP638_002209 [Amoeboaphelidium occidentale]